MKYFSGTTRINSGKFNVMSEDNIEYVYIYIYIYITGSNNIST